MDRKPVNVENPNVLSAFFTVLFTSKVFHQQSQVSVTSGKVWSKDFIREHLSKLGIDSSIGLYGSYPHVLRELAVNIVGPPSIMFERQW